MKYIGLERVTEPYLRFWDLSRYVQMEKTWNDGESSQKWPDYKNEDLCRMSQREPDNRSLTKTNADKVSVHVPTIRKSWHEVGSVMAYKCFAASGPG